ncbi:hypothetical protein [Streptomyces sp. TLI_235]|uniref:hypothetical protein n=1 Tax=Kitasatospora sp. NPDC085879 TaxID=3154769 RepID=UPI00211C01E4|nr:hypothetical protein [Streptomyces sp. TLI_235]
MDATVLADRKALPVSRRYAGGGLRPVRVASVPAGHVYVRHLASLGARWPVTRLADPRPCGAPSSSQRWWPPVMLDPVWVRENADRFDVFHLHFGFDAQTPEQLAELVEELRRRHKPLVYTVHDLENPTTRIRACTAASSTCSSRPRSG